MYNIGRLKLSGKAWLAPMEGVSDVAFRALCKKYGAAATPTEFLSANALARQIPKMIKLTATAQEEDVKIIQIFGQNAGNIAKATEWITAENRFDCIDMNMGCPSPKVLMQGAGSALLRRPDKIDGVLKAIIDHTDLPVSIKIRLGMHEGCIITPQLVALAQDLGLNHVTIHARTVKQGYGGKADWAAIADAVNRYDIPIIANGDIVSGLSAKACLEQTKAAGVMIGRAARANPFIFSEINAALADKEFTAPTPQDKINAFYQYLDLYKKYDVDDWSSLKSHAMQFTKGIPQGAKTRLQITHAKTIDDIRACMNAVLKDADTEI